MPPNPHATRPAESSEPQVEPWQESPARKCNEDCRSRCSGAAECEITRRRAWRVSIRASIRNSWDLRKWRKKHGFNQFEAAEKLGINRGGFQNWEREVRPISRAVELACQEITRLSQQRPDFGPVIFVCADGPILQQSDEPRCVALMRCVRHPNNEAAIEEAVRLRLDSLLVNGFILSEDGSVIWESAELVDECNRRSRGNPGTP
jgi:DNA-binding XRE family transcriptional regulator